MSKPHRHLKRISASDLRVGMYLHSFDGSWLDYPFWRTQRLLSSPREIAAIQRGNFANYWIDTERGLDVAAAPKEPTASDQDTAGPPKADQAQAALHAAAEAQASILVSPRVSLAEEMRVARQLCDRSLEAVQMMFGEARMGRAIEIESCLPLVNDVAQSVARHTTALISLTSIKTKDNYTYMHSVAVCALMISLARARGLDDNACREAGLAGLLHDLGKAVIPMQILTKPASLSAAEYAVMKSHPYQGYNLLSKSKGMHESVLDVCLNHHERIDGTGYPNGLSEDLISGLARMGSVCDVYDAVTSDRPYKKAWNPAEALSRMASWQGQFDTNILYTLVRTLGIYPNCSLVRLESNRLAVVMEQNPGKLTAPVVRIFYSLTNNLPIKPYVVDLSRGEPDRIVDREPLDKWGQSYVQELWANGLVQHHRAD